MPHESQVLSFMVRFVYDEASPAGAGRPPWRGLIRHIQSNTEQPFTHWAEAVAFMERYVALDPPAVVDPRL
jgi:hypothetical protein